MPSVKLNLEDMQAAAADACRLMKVLSNPDRLMLLCQLVQGEHNVGELEAALGIVQPTLSQQLGILRETGIAETRRDGKQIFYRLTQQKAAQLIAALYDIFCQKDDVS